MEETKALLKIIKAFMEEREIVLEEIIDEKKLYELARRHGMSNFLMDWSKSDCQSELIKQSVSKDYSRQIIKDTNQNVELEKILEAFERSKIKTLVVKGIVMKEIYPQNYMRPMCDMDILVHEENFKQAREIMKTLGFDELEDSEHHVVFGKQEFVFVELHRKLTIGDAVDHNYFNHQIWDLAQLYQNYENIYKMTNEDAYLFCMSHLIRHFTFTGIEIKDVLDVYLLNEKYKDSFDYEKINQKLKEFGNEKFEENIRKIAYKWFGTAENEDFDEVEEFILKGASQENHIYYHIGEKKGKLKYVVRLLFPEYKVIKERYHILKKVPILLPFAWGVRIVTDVFSKKASLKERMDTVKFIGESKQEEVDKIQQIYRKLGII